MGQQGLHALSHAYKGGSSGDFRNAPSAVRSHDSHMPTPTHYAHAGGPTASSHNRYSGSGSGGGSSNSLASVGSSSRSHEREQARSMTARFEAVHHKSLSLARLGEKHSQIYANAADQNAHHTMESLPYLLPPIGFATLLLVFGGSYSIKRWQRLPDGKGLGFRVKGECLRVLPDGKGECLRVLAATVTRVAAAVAPPCYQTIAHVWSPRQYTPCSTKRREMPHTLLLQ